MIVTSLVIYSLIVYKFVIYQPTNIINYYIIVQQRPGLISIRH